MLAGPKPYAALSPDHTSLALGIFAIAQTPFPCLTCLVLRAELEVLVNKPRRRSMITSLP